MSNLDPLAELYAYCADPDAYEPLAKPPRDHLLTDDEVSTIPDFGIF